MRALVLSLAVQVGLLPVERSLDLSGLAEADHVFLTNSISRVIEARQCNDAPLQRRAGPALDRLRALIAARFEAD
jgi:branched-subunit amino acid aminotransferase/4-amino-4-deoxychorismate lyase